MEKGGKGCQVPYGAQSSRELGRVPTVQGQSPGHTGVASAGVVGVRFMCSVPDPSLFTMVPGTASGAFTSSTAQVLVT